MPGKAGAARDRDAGARAAAAAEAVNKASAAATTALLVVALGVWKGAAADQAPAAAGVSLEPGQWEMVTRVTTMEIPGASPEAQAQIRNQVGQSQTNQDCLTAERARNPIQEMREAMSRGQAASCRFTDEVFGGGVIRIHATCPGAVGEGSSGQIAMEGSFTATTLQATLTLNVRGTNPAVPGATGMRVTAELRGRRLGECPVPTTTPPPAIGVPAPAPAPIAPAPPAPGVPAPPPPPRP
jgi:hypothetical protein